MKVKQRDPIIVRAFGGPAGGDLKCPLCGHGLTGRKSNWVIALFKGKPRDVLCDYVTISQNSLVDTWDYCACPDALHRGISK